MNRRYAAARPRPHILLDNAVSVDGRLDGFEADVGLVQETAGYFEAQAILTGSNTIVAAFFLSGEVPT